MKNSEIKDPLFREALEAIDSGDTTKLKNLLKKYPRLVADRFDFPETGYFKHPYLLWFVADNPIRTDKLPPNILEVTSILIDNIKRTAPDSVQAQLTYALELVATGRIPRESGVQIAMIDMLIDAGARPDDGAGALANGNIAAAERLIERGGNLSLITAVCLERMEDVTRLAPVASKDERLAALTAAGFYGKPGIISFLLETGADPNGYPKGECGFHAHGTPLHQTICSGSLDAVKLLVEAGAKLDLKDKIYDGTPLDWAEYMQTEEGHDEPAKRNFALIADYLRERRQTN